MDTVLVDKAFNKAKVGLMSTKGSVFISTVLFSLVHSWDNSIPTACTNGKFLKMNTQFFMDLTEKQRIFLLAHEAWHVAFIHMDRLKERDHMQWNRAADYVINVMLTDAGYEMPVGGLHDTQYRGMTTEQVYNCLPQPEEDDDFESDLEEFDGDTKEEKKEAESQVEEILVKAATQSKMASEDNAAGALPGEIQRQINELIHPKLDWRTVLQNYMSAFASDDYSFRKPNRRFFPDMYLPSLHSESVADICIAVDTSGSVTRSEFTAFLSEINSIKETLNPMLTTIIDFDTSIKKVHKLSQDDSIEEIEFSGYGGTRLRPVFEYYDKTEPTVLIVFSDLCCPAVLDEPSYPVIWIVVNNPNAVTHFGEKIDYDTTGN